MDNLRIILKVTPVTSSRETLQEFVVSDDLFCSLSYLENRDLPTSSFSNKNYSFTDNILTTYGFIMDSTFVCYCHESVLFIRFRKKIKVGIDAILFSVIVVELKHSRTFRKNFLHNFWSQYLQNQKFSTLKFCENCHKSNLFIHVVVHLRTPKKDILDSKWCGKIQVLVNERCELENAMAWLSTLGGAFSALGDTYVQCAEKAGQISIQQLRIAFRLGDPLTVCRCEIYLAMSLLQRGHFKKTKLLIRELYKFSTEGEGSKDFRLKNMCIAVWNRLKYLKSLQAIKEKSTV